MTHLQNEMLINNDMLGIAAERIRQSTLGSAVVSTREAVRTCAELFEIVLARLARPTAIDHAADRGDVSGFEFFDVLADRRHATDDLMARNAGI